MADSLAKEDIHLGLDALIDFDNESRFETMIHVIVARKLSSTFLPAAKQIGVNKVASSRYLDLVL